MTKPLTLVAGATGTVGSEVVRQLGQGGHNVRALVRDPANAPAFGAAVSAETDCLIQIKGRP